MIIQALCTSFKVELLTGTHDWSSDTFKLALYTEAAELGASTTAYSSVNEVSGTNYTAGGATLTPDTPYASGTTAIGGFSNLTFSALTVSGIRGGLIYNSSKSNRAVCVLDFGRTFNKTAEDFLVTMPTASSLLEGPVRIE